jgi:hypothetical protein
VIVDLDLRLKLDAVVAGPVVQQLSRQVLPTRQAERHVEQRIGADGTIAAAQCAGLADQEYLLTDKRSGLEAALRQGIMQAGDVDLAADQPLVDIAAVAADEAQ